MLDYPLGLALLLVPNLLGYADAGGAAVWVPRIIGALTIVQSIFTRYELGLIKLIPMRMHLINDYPAGAFLAASPWLLGFYNAANQRMWLPHLIVGLSVLLATALTQKEPLLRSRDRSQTPAPA
ncbi:MAG TPA: SPW repeat protein [Candidatus Acidoferrum sp.]|nr:SPW repeat protein [Candidatus Acidoferrum sp.]